MSPLPMSSPSVEVKKLIPVNLDLGSVALFDMNPFEGELLSKIPSNAPADRQAREAALLAITRDNCQLLMNALYALPRHVDEANDADRTPGRLTTLPKPTTTLPREKPVPVEKPQTRWEKFAAAKGIQKRKRSAKVFDEASGEWKYRYGSRSAKNDPMADWCEEVQ